MKKINNIIKNIIYLPIGLIVFPFLLLILKAISIAILANNCDENPLPEQLDKLAQEKAKELKEKRRELKIGWNDTIEEHVDQLDIYNSLDDKTTELLKAHIANYYYCDN